MSVGVGGFLSLLGCSGSESHHTQGYIKGLVWDSVLTEKRLDDTGVAVPHVGSCMEGTATSYDRLRWQNSFKQSALLLKQLDVFYPQTCQASLIIDNSAKKAFFFWAVYH